MKKGVSFLLALFLLLGLTACGGKEKDAWDGGPIYSAETLDYTSEQLRVLGGCAIGDSFYLMDTTAERLASGLTMRDVDRLQRVSPEDGAAQPLPAYQTADASEAQRKFIWSSVLRLGADETLCQTMKLSNTTYDLPEDFDEENGDWNPYTTKNWQGWVLRRLDTEGRELFRFEEETVSLEDRLEIGSISDLMMDGDGEIAVIGETGVAVLNMDGALRFTLPVEEPEFLNCSYRLILMGDGGVGMAECAAEGGRCYIRLRTINKETLDWGKKYLLPDLGGVFDGAGDVLFYYLAGDEMRAWKEDTQDAGKGETVLNWVNLGIDASQVSTFAAEDGGRLLALIEERDAFGFADSIDGEQELLLLTATEKPDRKVLTYASLGILNDERAAILEFNRTNPDYQIVVKDYADYSPNASREDAIMRLATEIGAGKIPDILVIEDMPVEQWGASGLLEDLWPWIDKDPDISREDLMERVLQAMEMDGKLYDISDTFYMDTVLGPKDIVGEQMTWTPEEMEAALAKMPEGCIGIDMGGVELLLNILCLDWGQFVDWEKGACSFDSEDFKSLLKFCGQYPQSVPGIGLDRVNAGQQLIASIYPHDFETVQLANAVVRGEAAFVGYPNPWGRVGSCFKVERAVSMCSVCKNKEGAWAFMRTLLLPSEPPQSYLRSNYFYINKENFQKSAQKAMSADFEYERTLSEVTVIYHKVTQDEYDQLMALYDAIDTVRRRDPDLETIITEAAGAYFAGDKTLDETAALIQNRAQLYVSERT